MTPKELEQYIKSQAQMSARIAQKQARARQLANAYSAQGGSRSNAFAQKVIQSLTRPGVAPGHRPVSATGAQTFHFALTSVNRTSDFVRKLKGKRTGEAAAHESYIEREGAAERLGAQFAKTKAEMLDDVWEALGGQSYIERPGAAEEVEGYRLASFGNIAEKFEDRIAFWEAMENAASKPTSSGITTQRGNDLAFWAKVDADPDAPEVLKNAPPFIPLPDKDPASENNIPRVTAAVRYTDATAEAVLNFFRKHSTRMKGTPKAKAPVALKIDPGRGGRIQSRLIVELPHELSPQQRLKLAQDYCHKKFVEGREQPLRHWCVIHAPDHHNDPRNVHMHIIFAERPTKRMTHPETGEECWDFEVQIKIRDENKHHRLSRPYEQKADRGVNSSQWVKQARKDYASLANLALEAAGKSKIYDARTYKAMGIDEVARDRINGKDYIREKRGESTPAGDAIIKAQWEREEARLAKRFTRFGPQKKFIDAFDAEIARWKLAPSSVQAHLQVHKHEYSLSIAMIRVMKAERAANAFVLSKIQSKIMPPLQARDEDALEAQDFIRMFKTDIVLRHNSGIKNHEQAARHALTALSRAQKADPKTTTDAGFLTGRPDIAEMTLPMPLMNDGPGHETFQDVYKAWREGMKEEVAERRVLREAMLEQVAARRGDIIRSFDDKTPPPQAPTPEQLRHSANVELHIAAMAARPQTETMLAIKREAAAIVEKTHAQIDQGAGTQEPQRAARTIQPQDETAKPPGNQSSNKARPTAEASAKTSEPDSETKTGDHRADTIRTVSARLEKAMPEIVAAARADLPADKRRYGDEIAIAFMSETGEPIQRRVYSPIRIRTADEQAAAVAAAVERRRAERQAKLDAEVAAMRAPPRENISPTPQPSEARQGPSRPAAQDPTKAAATSTQRPTEVKATPKGNDEIRTSAGPVRQPHQPTIDSTQRQPSKPTTQPQPQPQPHPQSQPRAASNPNASITPKTEAPTRPKQHHPASEKPESPEHQGPKTTNAATPQADGLAGPGAPKPDPKNKLRVKTAEELRRRALMAAKSRGRGR